MIHPARTVATRRICIQVNSFGLPVNKFVLLRLDLWAFWGMRKTKLPIRDQQICGRLRRAREEILEITQSACAARLGLDRSTLANYEAGRSALRFEMALRFCREFIISEEWLATGKFDAFYQALESLGQSPIQAAAGRSMFDNTISVRQCVDLWSDPIARHIKPGTAFSAAYASGLDRKYAEYVREFTFYPYLRLSEADAPGVALNYLQVAHSRHVLMLANAAVTKGVRPSDMWRVYTRCVISACDLIWRRQMGSPSSESDMLELGWLRSILNNPNGTLPTLVGGSWEPPMDYSWARSAVHGPQNDTDSSVSSLQNVTELDNFKSVTPAFADLLLRLNVATEERGKKSELANFLGVSLPVVSVWLAGKREPGGEATLRLLEWVQAQEAKQKSSDRATTQPEQRTQLRKIRETEPHPSPD